MSNEFISSNSKTPSTGSRSRGSINAFCRTMGRNLGRHLYSRSSSQRILSGVQGTTTSNGSDSHVYARFHRESVCNRERNSDSVAKECHRKSSRKRKIVGFLQYNFPDKEKIRRIAPYSKSKQSKSLPAAFPFPNGNPTINYKKPTTGRMDNCIGSDGCLFSCTDPSLPSQISTLLLQRPVLPVQSASVRAFDRSSSVYESSAGDCRTPLSGVYSLSSVSGRLATEKQKSQSSVGPGTKGYRRYSKAGFSHKHREVESPSKSVVCISGSSFRSQAGPSFPYSGTICSHSGFDRPIPSSRISTSSNFSEAVGHNGVMHRRDPLRTSAYETDSDVSPVLLETFAKGRSKLNSGFKSANFSSGVVDYSTEFIQRSSVESPLSGHGFNYGCQQVRLGSPFGRLNCSGSVEFSGATTAYQQSGVVGSSQCTSSFLHFTPGKACASQVGQQHSDSIYKQSRGYKVYRPMHDSMAFDAVVYREGNNSNVVSYSRGEEHSSRCAEQENFSTHGMVSERQCSSSDFCNMGISLNRPFRIGQQPQDSSVLFLDSFEEGTLRGCSSNILVGNTGICVSSNSAFIPSTSESEAGGMHTHFDSPSLAQATMVSSSTGSSDRFPDRNSSIGYTISSTKDKVVSSSSRSVQFDSVAYIKQQLKEKGFSKSARKLLASAVRPGTQRVYKYKHRQFVCWCHKRNEDPVSCSISTVANFLACLFDKGLNYSTICGYRSAISALHEPVEGYKVGEHPRIVALLKGVFNRNPPKRTLLPPWDLRVVLKHIQNHPFEPLNQVDLKFKTMKAVFLLAITTGGRVSDLSLLGYKQPFLRIEKVAPGLRFAPTGLRKQDRPKHFEHEVFVPTYPHNKFLDPVRAVLIYLKATKSLREGSNSLFVTLTEPHNAPSPQTISKWIVNTIKTCYELEGKPLQTVRAHSTRSLSSSWALYSGVAMDRILQAVDWSKDTTFVKFYLKDVEHTVSDFASAVLDVGKDL